MALARRMLAALLIVAALGAAAISALLWTPPGRTAIASFVEARLGAVTGDDVSISRLGGALPGEVLLNEVVFSQNGVPWLNLDEVRLHWRPASLLHGAIRIESLAVDGADILGMKQNKNKSDHELKGFELPESLPNLAIHSLTLTNVRVAESVTGVAMRLDGAGSARMGGKAIRLQLDANSSGERDFISALIERDPVTDRLAADLTVASEANGVIAAFAALDGPLYLNAKSDAHLADFHLAIDGRFGAYGAVTGVIAGDLTKMNLLKLQGDAKFGERLAALSSECGPSAEFDLDFVPAETGGALEINRLITTAGEISGAVSWMNRRRALDRVMIDLNAEPAHDWRPEVQRYFGDELSLRGELRRLDETYNFTGAMIAPLIEAQFNDVETDLRKTLTGPVEINMKPNDELPAFLTGGANLTANFDIQFNAGAHASSIMLTTTDGGSISGDADFSFPEKTFYFKGDASLAPSMAAALEPSLIATDAITAAVEASGRLADFSATVKAVTPALAFKSANIAPADIALVLSGLPHTPSGGVRARTRKGKGRLDADFASASNGTIAIRNLSYAAGAFSLTGGAQFNRATKEASVNLDYHGDEGATPWPGITLAGDLKATGALSRNTAANRLDIIADHLDSGEWSVAGLEASASGPMEKLAVTAKTASFEAKGAPALSDIKTQLTASIRDKTTLAVKSFSGRVGVHSFVLQDTAIIEIGGGVSLRAFKASYGKNGTVSIDGVLDRRRWRAEIAASNAPIPNASSVVDCNISLDTDNRTPAQGSIKLTSQLTTNQAASIRGDIAWNGKMLNFRNIDAGDGFELDLSVPAVLIRNGSLRVQTDGKLSGAAHYAGRLETIAPFFPAFAQSLEGAVDLDLSLGGSTSEPTLSGDVKISDAAYTDNATGLSVIGIHGAANAETGLLGSTISFAFAGRGHDQKQDTLTAAGSLILGKNARLNSTLKLSDARLSAGPVSMVHASGEITLAGSLESLKAEGDIAVTELDAEIIAPEATGLVNVDVVVLNGDGVPQTNMRAARKGPSITYAIRVAAKDKIFVRGRGLESEWSAATQILGVTDAPLILGQMNLRRGWLDFSGRRFDLTRGQILFDRLTPNNPTLDIRAEYSASNGVVAAIVISGRARTPKISLEATPALPQEDIMALVLFGKPAGELSAFESLQVAQALVQLGGIGPFGAGGGPVGAARETLGLDLLNLDVGADAGASKLTVGKYVADGLFVAASQDARGENGSVRIEYEITDSITVESELKQNGDQTVSANWKKDF